MNRDQCSGRKTGHMRKSLEKISILIHLEYKKEFTLLIFEVLESFPKYLLIKDVLMADSEFSKISI